ncbi:hypothetical protein TPHA_0I00810 [Tetrapisispora phaffii CBS 4417]|uniref:U3 small nucleolar RNA-associated protein 10 n=1 Tax=Tetrapisispora phaffii (strain ATCC 24235 / CBS 4417 / NBRC 1672 / NRRL Y-8282 / UCD 70-5) TaxID=1071381 RepID=G8BXF9_TETPH|nr:hypothetical protein TPHA_0I00810 [Tetrapisispora phaffii CBS 4417]CCE64587.1 hypothetical protein TPHA_0I00810 [Tetrapisispora phaffii CBS 4417]
MSSLRDQLTQVASSNATVAFDRKRRQKLHSTSLIYNPKTAATQDYDTIFELATNALQELIEIDPNFEIFEKTLFSESSISIDRNVQTKEEIKDLEQSINGFLMLASSKWHLTPTLYATEWLVRRFQIHILNAEMFLLSTLNYYQTPSFKRILDIVKLPPLFQPLSAFVRSEKNPTNITMIKLFNDNDFIKLYTNYLNKCIKHKFTYTNQLLFTTCWFINVIAFNSNNEEKLTELIPILLEASAKLLGSTSNDCQIAAHTIMVIFATALPLNKNIIIAAVETILAGYNDKLIKKSVLISIFKLFQTLRGNDNVSQLPSNIYTLLNNKISLVELTEFISTSDIPTNADKFITKYIRSVIRYDHSKLDDIVKLLEKVELENFEMRHIITDLIHLSEIIDDKTKLIELFSYFVSKNETLVIKCLNSLNIATELFEIRLTTSLFTVKDKEQDNTDGLNIKNIDSEKVLGKEITIEPFKEFLEKHSNLIYTKSLSFLTEKSEIFNKLLSLFIESIGKGYSSGLFLSSFLSTIESKITFLLRVVISPAALTTVRIIAISNISKLLSNIDKDSNLFTLVPCLVCALNDVSKNVRQNVRKLLFQISKRPSTKHYFMLKEIYGENKEVPFLDPQDCSSWLSKFLDGYFVDNLDFSKLLVPRANDKILSLFWANQALLIPLPYPKLVLLRNLMNVSKTSSYSYLFETFISSYVESRGTWEQECKLNKTNFIDFETVIVNLISEKEKNNFMIDFMIEALNSSHEGLAEITSDRLIKLFPTFKPPVQLHIVQSIVDSINSDDVSYDTAATLQALPMNADIFVSLLGNVRITSDDGVSDIAKRRRRRSSTNKPVFQRDDVSLMAELHLRKLTILLETLDKSKPVGTAQLLSTLFTVLSDLETLGEDGALPVLYAQETLASCMTNTIDSLKSQNFTQLPNTRADSIISAIRNSQSPQVQNKLLLVIGSLATLAPETVLHSVMPIFTFMGVHAIRQDNEFTAQVVEKTILTVIPALLESSQSNINEEIEFLLMTFATALNHVPKHRRVKLYFTLVKTLGASNAIAPFIFLISQQYSNCINTFKLGDAKGFVEFTKSFLSSFDVADQLKGVCQFFDIVKLLISANSNEKTENSISSRTLFSNGICNYSDLELLSFYKNAFTFVNKIVEDSDSDYYDFQSSLKLKLYSVLLDVTSDSTILESIQENFGSLLQTVVSFINGSKLLVNKTIKEFEDSSSENEVADYQTDIKNTLFSVMSNVLTLLPINYFVNSTLPLLNSSTSAEIRYNLTSVIGKKFESESSKAVDSVKIVIEMLVNRVETDKSDAMMLQVDLKVLSSLAAKFGEKLEGSTITNLLSLGTNLLQSDKFEVKIPSLNLITNCIQILGIKSLSFYPKVVPQSLVLFKELQEGTNTYLRPQLQLSILLLFTAMVKRIPSFITSNLYDLIDIILFSNDVEVSSRLSVVTLMIENIDQKEILKTLHKIWIKKLSKSSSSISISLFLSALESTVESISKKSATSQSPTFFKLMLALFEFRSISEFDNNTISRIEASVHQIANSYVLKLNDKVFRPLFVIVVKWAFDGEGVTNKEIKEVERLIAFYKFFGKLQENLKTIITSYFTYLLEPTNELLKRFISRDLTDVNLRRLILISLTSSFKYDKEDYWNSTSRFELISTSLVSQLSNIDNVIGNYLVKAIASLTTNNGRIDEHNKIMHNLLVEHVKSSTRSSEKLWTIRTMKLIYSKVGEQWLILLPQLVPTIAELLEDENEEVENEVRTGLVKVVENVLGEPFDRYLS